LNRVLFAYKKKLPSSCSLFRLRGFKGTSTPSWPQTALKTGVKLSSHAWQSTKLGVIACRLHPLCKLNRNPKCFTRIVHSARSMPRGRTARVCLPARPSFLPPHPDQQWTPLNLSVHWVPKTISPIDRETEHSILVQISTPWRFNSTPPIRDNFPLVLQVLFHF
jgi:hypothetical protein